MARRVILGCLLVAGVVSLVSLNVVAGTLLAVCILASPVLLAVLLSRDPMPGDWPDEIV